MLEKNHFEQPGRISHHAVETDVDVDLREVYFLIMHFLSSGPCQRTFGQLFDELLAHQLLPRRYHACYSSNSVGNENDDGDGISLPLSYSKLVERYSHIEKDHLVKLLKQLIMFTASPGHGKVGDSAPNAADVPTLLGSDSFSLLNCDRRVENKRVKPLPAYMRWPHMQADQVRGLSLREIGGGFTKHRRAPSIRSACYAIAKPSTMFQRMQNMKKLRGHRDSVYCAIFDRTGRYVITGSDDRLVKIWSMETAYCLTSCRGHEGDITDLAVSSNNLLVASASNDFVIRVWRIPDGAQISVLRGHTGSVTAIAFSPRPTSVYQLLSSSDDGTCRIWDVRSSQCSPLIYLPNPSAAIGKSNGSSIHGSLFSNGLQSHQILCCAYNANGTFFVTGSSDTYARVWSACKLNVEDSEQPIHELDLLSGHENDVNYVQFSGCAVPTRSSTSDIVKENIPKFKNSWFCHDNIVTCSRDGSAIIWIPRSRRSHGKIGRWVRAYHLRVPPPPLPPQPLRGGPRQRLLPTPRGVNMIIWSLDNHFVLAAIMDCRICVWNAVDGSLVHSLTGHTQSSYVLDVHPFNPRIAMSAGYDGKTIVWDIWEGSPIRTYEVGPYKLVDGKFSPDGTSIVLSDEVGQIYLLNTGQGESQKDAKYDQFFLGDYRPLIRDSSGNVLDQETQLPPHRRNIQDPLCDSSLIPYPEPYQTMYQNRRLGALGLEWHPSSINLVVGQDISLGQDYLMPPLEDLDRIFEPLPQFIEPMYWEPENEAVSDDPDSEYNVAEECFSEGERDSLGSHYSSEPERSADDSDPVAGNKDGLRKSRRRNHATGMEMTSGGCVRKRNSDEYDGSLSGSNRVKKSKSWRKASKRKSSTKSLRPQRVAARNALSMFSKMNERSTDGDDVDDSEDDSSDSDLVLQDSGSWKLDRNFEHLKDTRKDQPSLVGSEDIVRTSEVSELQLNSGSRKRLVVKFTRPKKPVPSEEGRPISGKEADSTNPSFQEHTEEHMVGISSKYAELSSSNGMDDQPCQNHKGVYTAEGRHPDRAEDCAVECAGEKGKKIGWREVRICTSKSSLLEGGMPSDAYTENFDTQKESSRDVNRDDKQFGSDALQEATVVEIRKPSPDTESSPLIDCKQKADTSTTSPLIDHKLKGKADASTASGTENLKENALPKLKFIIKTKSTSHDSRSLSNVITAVDEQHNDRRYDVMSGSHSCMVHDHTLTESEKGSGRSSFQHSLQADSKLKIGNVVQEKEKAHVARTDPLGFYGIIGEETSSLAHYHHSGTDLSEASSDILRRTRSMTMKATSQGPNSNCSFKMREMHGFVGSSKNEGRFSKKACDQQWVSGSKGAVRLRSSRNKQGDPGILTGKESESNHAIRKLSWLMLSKQEGGYSYIPQLGDEVAYLRQGHQGCIRMIGLPDVGPWTKGNVRAVEICKVKKLSYATLPGSGDCCCKITLKFVDPSSDFFGQTFELTLPDLISSPDFVVEKTWFDDSCSRNWANGDKCWVWWRSNENGEGGSWWEGKIISSSAMSDKFPNSPWERYCVQYEGDDEFHLHCPWELHDSVIPLDHAHIDFGNRDKLLDLFAKLEQSVTRHQDCYGFQKLNDAAQKVDFLNRFAVPLYPEIIELRLKNNYYRRVEALKQDIAVMLSNAELYFAKSAQLSAKVKHLKDWFTRKLSRF
ncbi:bromodomain and WD repeat-containing protein 3 isoform X2 [Tripterygium wilfordii]|nr:bromodomain and WD repeat-containing protein 3 isoform X2 [Tripterygium wilfordii]